MWKLNGRLNDILIVHGAVSLSVRAAFADSRRDLCVIGQTMLNNVRCFKYAIFCTLWIVQHICEDIHKPCVLIVKNVT